MGILAAEKQHFALPLRTPVLSLSYPPCPVPRLPPEIHNSICVLHIESNESSSSGQGAIRGQAHRSSASA